MHSALCTRGKSSNCTAVGCCRAAREIRHTSWSSGSVGKAGLSDGAKAERVLEMKERDGCWAVGEVSADVLTMEVQP